MPVLFAYACHGYGIAGHTAGSVGWVSLETHWSLILFYSAYLYPWRIYGVWLFLFALCKPSSYTIEIFT